MWSKKPTPVSIFTGPALSISYAGPDGEIHSSPRMSSRLFSGVLIAVVVAGVLLGLMIIVATGFGKEVTFDTIFPTLTDK